MMEVNFDGLEQPLMCEYHNESMDALPELWDESSACFDPSVSQVSIVIDLLLFKSIIKSIPVFFFISLFGWVRACKNLLKKKRRVLLTWLPAIKVKLRRERVKLRMS